MRKTKRGMLLFAPWKIPFSSTSRAYIAASRRSDRSLEARVESARRASEIHKRRTGRSLRVTEQDVINEEMYEEEDDDIPMQYRRLTAHLQTGSPEFNNKLSAYLTSNVAVRNTLDNIIQNSIANEHQRSQSTYASPLMSQPMYQQQYMEAYINPSVTFPPIYTIPTNGFHGRSASAVGTATIPHTATPSLPQARPLATSQQKSKSASPPSGSTRLAQPPSKSAKTPPQQQIKSDSPVPTLADTPSTTPPSRTSSISMLPQNHQQPLSTSLPIEAQQLLAQGVDSSDSFYQSMMTHPQYFAPQQYHSSTSMSLSKQHNFRPTVNGMSATLAPSALDMKHTIKPHNHSNQDKYPASASVLSRTPLEVQTHCDAQLGPFSAPPFQINFGANFPDLDTDGLSRQGSIAQNSDQATPGAETLDEGLWAQFMSEDFNNYSLQNPAPWSICKSAEKSDGFFGYGVSKELYIYKMGPHLSAPTLLLPTYFRNLRFPYITGSDDVFSVES